MVSQHRSARAPDGAAIIFSATTRRSNGGASRTRIPADLRGTTVLDIGCNAGFYSIEMKRRGADRVVGIDWDERYLAQARFAAEVSRRRDRIPRLSVYDVARSASSSISCCSWACSITCGIRCSRSICCTSMSTRDLLVFQSMLRGSRHGRAGRRRLSVQRDERSSTRPAIRSCISSSSVLRRSDELVDPEPRRAEAMLRSAGFDDPRASGRRSVHLPARAAAGRANRARCTASAMIEAVMFWNEPNNLSHWDFELDHDWRIFAPMVRLAADAVARRESAA